MKFASLSFISPESQKQEGVFTNRAVAYLKQKKFKEALRDCENALFINNKFAKAHLRATTCYIQLGELQKAQSAIEQAIALGEESADRIS